MILEMVTKSIILFISYSPYTFRHWTFVLDYIIHIFNKQTLI